MDKILKTFISTATSIEGWVTRNPRVAISIGLFILGFILGLLF